MKVYREAEVQHHSFSGYLQIKDCVFLTQSELKCISSSSPPPSTTLKPRVGLGLLEVHIPKLETCNFY
jgi:hypothetical protein